ncbi:MAG: nuclear transport factor 2 family protein [Chloroflexota bacterium]|nr:nuclear transport factor 2 family protein [Chloroflexota bacterium]
MSPQDPHHRRDDLRVPSGDPPVVADEPVTVAPMNDDDATAIAGGSDTDAGRGAGAISVGTGLGTADMDGLRDSSDVRRAAAAAVVDSRTAPFAADRSAPDRPNPPRDIVPAFLAALGHLERDRDPEPMVALFGSACRLQTILDDDEWSGPDGARAFWERYRDSFGDVRSTFHSQLETDDRVALEWTTEATTVTGEPLRYAGACFLDLADGQVVGFRAYFAPAALGR